jgi:hypothetical protein
MAKRGRTIKGGVRSRRERTPPPNGEQLSSVTSSAIFSSNSTNNQTVTRSCGIFGCGRPARPQETLNFSLRTHIDKPKMEKINRLVNEIKNEETVKLVSEKETLETLVDYKTYLEGLIPKVTPKESVGKVRTGELNELYDYLENIEKAIKLRQSFLYQMSLAVLIDSTSYDDACTKGIFRGNATLNGYVSQTSITREDCTNFKNLSLTDIYYIESILGDLQGKHGYKLRDTTFIDQYNIKKDTYFKMSSKPWWRFGYGGTRKSKRRSHRKKTYRKSKHAQ